MYCAHHRVDSGVWEGGTRGAYLGIPLDDGEAGELGQELAAGARGHDAGILQRLQQLLDGLQVLRPRTPDALVEIRRHHRAGAIPRVQLQQQSPCTQQPCEISKYHQSISKSHPKVLQDLTVSNPMREALGSCQAWVIPW